MANDFGFYMPQQQTAQESMPAMTPSLILDSQLQQIEEDTTRRENSLIQQLKAGVIDEQGYFKNLQKLQAEYDDAYSQINTRKQQLQTLQQMSQAGLMEEGQAAEAGWRGILPKDVEVQMFPKEATERAPFSPAQVKAIGEEAEAYLESAEEPDRLLPRALRTENRHWFLPRFLEGEERKSESVLDKYKAFRTTVGYNALTPAKQAQADQVWDEFARNKKYNWDPDSPEVMTLRGRGRLSKTYGARISGTPTNTADVVSPFQQSLTPKPQRAAAPQKIEVINPEGERGYIPANELQTALAEGYKRAR